MPSAWRSQPASSPASIPHVGAARRPRARARGARCGLPRSSSRRRPGRLRRADRGRTRYRSRGEAAPTAARASGCRPADRSRSRRARSAASICDVRRALSIAASRCADHSVRPRDRAASDRSCSRGVSSRGEVGDRDPPARRDGRLLGAGGGEHRLGRGLEQPLASVRERVMAGGAIGVRGRPGELQVALERLSDRDGIGLRVDDDPLGGRGSSGTRSRRPARSRERDRVGRDRVRYPLALDQPHVPTRRW